MGTPKQKHPNLTIFFAIFGQRGSLDPLVYFIVFSSVGNGRVPISEKHLGAASFGGPRPSMAL